MKVLYVSGMYPNPTYPQKGIFCHEQVKALKQIGVEVDVIVPMTIYDKEYITSTWEFEGVTIRYIRYFKLPGTLGVEHIGKHLYHALMRAHIDFSQYDVLHADSPLPTGDALMRISKRYDVPFVVHCHGLDVFMDVDYKDAPNCSKIVEKCADVYSAANAIVGVSQKVLNNIIARLPVADKCFPVYNGVDVKLFSMSEPVPHGRLQIVAIGNLIDLKGHDITIKALKQLIRTGKNKVDLSIYGRGGKESELKKLVRSLDLQNYVTFYGYVPYERIAKDMENYDLFVLPSWYEAIGCVYLEAMASGVVSVGCYENGIDEVIRNGENGFLVRPHEVEDVIKVLDYAYDCYNSAEFRKIAAEGRSTVQNHFKWIDSVKALLAVYEKIV